MAESPASLRLSPRRRGSLATLHIDVYELPHRVPRLDHQLTRCRTRIEFWRTSMTGKGDSRPTETTRLYRHHPYDGHSLVSPEAAENPRNIINYFGQPLLGFFTKLESKVNDQRWADWTDEEKFCYEAIFSAVRHVLRIYDSEPKRTFGSVGYAEEYAPIHHQDGLRWALELANDIAEKIDFYKGTDEYLRARSTAEKATNLVVGS